jgi:hypothetical protein
MKALIFIAGLFMGFNANAQKFDLVQINADWNKKNSIQFTQVAGIPIQYARLEDQPANIVSNIKSVPILVLYVNGRVSYTWSAGIDLKCKATPAEVEYIINKFRN